MSIFGYPSELLDAICSHIYDAGIPPAQSSLDPIITTAVGIPVAQPSSSPQPYWPEPLVRRTLASLCLVNHAWFEAAKPWLWRRLEVRLPRTWLSLVEEIAWNLEEETVDCVMGKSIQAAARAVADVATFASDKDAALKLEASLLDTLDPPDNAITLDLLSPIPSRNPSPRRIRPKSKSPARWKILRSINDAIQDVLDRRAPGVYVPIPKDPRPGRYVQHLDFNHFRTIGMRRSVEEGVNCRFVTGDRVEAILKEMPNLTTFGATEYMDGALTLPVLNELFLRGAPSGGRGRPSRGRSFTDLSDAEEEDHDRRRECKDLEAVDLTGCVSAVFVNAFNEFVNAHLLHSETGFDDEMDCRRNRRIRFAEEPLSFPGIRRLGLRGVKSILPRYLGPFILAFPSLTHLDLSGTRVTPEIMDAFALSSTVQLKSLALARCVRLTGQSIRNLLVNSPVTAHLTELNLYCDVTYLSPLTQDDLYEIVSEAPCFLSGDLQYLDLSGAPLTKEILERFKPQLKLRSLGLSHISRLELKVIQKFMIEKSPNVEVLTLISTSPELDFLLRPNSGSTPRNAVINLHSHLIRPLATPPFSFSISGSNGPLPPRTRLRVVELSPAMLGALGVGAGAWRIIRSKGGRGWYVDTACTWVAEPGSGSQSVLKRDLPPGHPYRVEMERLSDAKGNVSSGTGWHARKMEVLHGYGMLGREDGLYGAVSFAYQG
ncbi:hypothetical protein AGABI2DRAFT_218464 [Agaricus bisporus var. bisporus H97]|uniref:hypothetical protein n=1 Tax=Agaricus bisporus var. bisporus (strain H97 / ATCC MYA-4626 / FGSC 10389) TaxID=936046 RepID=UPI00029F73A0|nr:hypothetical protein AGABI2DRAFT_218464 [Agaricus bisporus var. bisporus H97]EKV49269.1 hypothetical protein AGABI2DRAFT_218464 [Agaricus bisporus var. bisporus H97]